jgi:hypothetical protein
VVVFHAGHKVGKAQLVKGDEKGPVTFRLEPYGALTGRILDAEGKPCAGLKVTSQASLERADDKENSIELRLGILELPGTASTTDKDGRFRIEGLVPGLKYVLNVREGKENVPGYSREEFTAESGRTRDLGNLVSRPAAGGKKE